LIFSIEKNPPKKADSVERFPWEFLVTKQYVSQDPLNFIFQGFEKFLSEVRFACNQACYNREKKCLKTEF